MCLLTERYGEEKCAFFRYKEKHIYSYLSDHVVKGVLLLFPTMGCGDSSIPVAEEISASVWDRCQPKIVRVLGSY